jgi:hypothetical protein
MVEKNRMTAAHSKETVNGSIGELGGAGHAVAQLSAFRETEESGCVPLA